VTYNESKRWTDGGQGELKGEKRRGGGGGNEAQKSRRACRWNQGAKNFPKRLREEDLPSKGYVPKEERGSRRGGKEGIVRGRRDAQERSLIGHDNVPTNAGKKD